MFNLTEKSKDFLLNIVTYLLMITIVIQTLALNHTARPNMVMNGIMRITPIKQMVVFRPTAIKDNFILDYARKYQ